MAKHIRAEKKVDHVALSLHKGNLTKAKESVRKHIERYADEIKILSSVRGHEAIVVFVDHDLQVSEDKDKVSIHIWILKEYYKEILPDKIKDNTFSLFQRLKTMHQIAKALVFLHNKNIIHRDIKPDNILIDSQTGHAKLDDFGQARVTSPEVSLTLGGIGTPLYSAPEVDARQQGYDGKKADIFSLGAVFYECLTGTPPFLLDIPELANEDEFYNQILKNKTNQRLGKHNFLNDKFLDVLYQATSPKPVYRFSSMHDMAVMLEELLHADLYNNEGIRYIQDFSTTKTPELMQRAKQNFEFALHIASNNKQAWLNLGNIHKFCNDIDQAKECYQRALDLDPEYQIAKDNLKAL